MTERKNIKARPSDDGATEIDPTPRGPIKELQPMTALEIRTAIEANRPRKPVIVIDEETLAVRHITTTDNIRQSSVAICGRCGYHGNSRQFAMNPNRPTQLICEECIGQNRGILLEPAPTVHCSECGRPKH